VSGTPVPVEEAAVHLAGGGVVAFTGAGISAESGIPTFRDPGGVWERFEPGEFGTWDGLLRLAMSRPDALAEFLSELRTAFAAAHPGAAHQALARMESEGVVEGVITQNVDGLHQEAGNVEVVEIHGSFSRSVCIVCGHRDPVSREEFMGNLDRAVMGLRTAFIASLSALLPHCSSCGGPARPDFVAFGEALHEFDRADRMARSCRAMLVVGTSGEVFPAAHLPETASRAGATVVEVAMGPTYIEADLRLEGLAGEILPALAEAVLRRRASVD
jgi:NAD-dependent deacetylase